MRVVYRVALSAALAVLLYSALLRHQQAAYYDSRPIESTTTVLKQSNDALHQARSFAGKLVRLCREHPCLHSGLRQARKWQQGGGWQQLLNMTEAEYELFAEPLHHYAAAIENLRLLFVADTMGIVLTSSHKSLISLALSLKMLRRIGCQLPVEVIQPAFDQDQLVCEHILRPLNARCISLHKDVAAELENGYQAKIWAVLQSTFQHVLFLDADAFPITDPTPIFSSQNYTNAGLVVMRDFWNPVVSEHFYRMLNISVPEPPPHSTESGVFWVNKGTHAKMLMINAYINLYGPERWYRLLAQGSLGEGDKETLIASAMIAKEPYFQTPTSVMAFGYTEKSSKGDSRFKGVAMIHIDEFRGATGHAQPLSVFVHSQFKFRLVVTDRYQNTLLNHVTHSESGTFRKPWQHFPSNRLSPAEREIEAKLIGEVQTTAWRDLLDLGCGQWRHIWPVTDEQCSFLQNYVHQIFESDGDGLTIDRDNSVIV